MAGHWAGYNAGLDEKETRPVSVLVSDVIKQTLSGRLVLADRELYDGEILDVFFVGQWVRGVVKQKHNRWLIVLEDDRHLGGLGRMARRWKQNVTDSSDRG